MLSAERNALLTQTGPGTPMGELLRRYWAPALLSEELPEPEGPPVPVTLLGEELLAFRDSAGRVGLVDRYCAHRGASLFFGRNEAGGLRCVYHGWKYDVAGRCLDMPNEPAESAFAHKVRLKAYPCAERGGLVWAYLGPSSAGPSAGEPNQSSGSAEPGRPPLPPLPEFEWALAPPAHRRVAKRLQECNYLQALEGGVDLSHLSFLHRVLDSALERPDQLLTRRDPSPRFEVADTEGGLLIAARRAADPDHYYWRISQFLMPWYTLFPPLLDEGMGGHAWVPIDDERCWAYSFTWDPERPLSAVQDEGIYPELEPSTLRPRANRDNDYLIDRAAQRTRSFTGIPGITPQDCAVQESMGRLYDRRREHLGTTDLPIIALRRKLLAALEALRAGQPLPGLDPASQRVRPAAFVLSKQTPMVAAARQRCVAPMRTVQS